MSFYEQRNLWQPDIDRTEPLPWKTHSEHLKLEFESLESQNFKNLRMNRDEILNLALANMLDIIPVICNTDDESNPELNAILLSIYERNMAILNAV